MIVHIDAQTLERNASNGLASYQSGGRLTGEQVRRLACDTKLVVILADGSEVLDVGRSTRTVSTPLRRALMARDRGCASPGCTEHRPRRLHAHHVWHWADGGPTSLDNLVLLCKAHHHAVHHNGFTITSNRGRFSFTSAAGAVLEQNPALTLAMLERLPELDFEYTQRWAGGPLELDYVLTTLIQRRAQRARQREPLAA